MTRTPLSTPAIKGMKPGCKDKSDTGEHAGLRVSCGAKGVKSFYYRYKSPINKDKITAITFGYFPVMSLSVARTNLLEMKAIRKSGRCPKAERDEGKRLEREEAQLLEEREQVEAFTVTDLVDLYLEEYIEDRTINGKLVAGARKKKGQSECRRTLYGDAVKQLGELPAAKVTRKLIVEMIMSIVGRGAKVQAGNVLREFALAYDFSIGMERFDDDFINPAMAAKSSLKMTNIKLTSTPGDRFLTDDELVKFFVWLPSSGYATSIKNAMRLTLWSGMRTGAVVQAEWKEIDLDKAIYFVPADKSKMKTDQYVQLPVQAVEFLRQLKLMTGPDYLFESTKTGLPIQQKYMTESKWAMKNPGRDSVSRRFKPEECWLATIPDWSPHDLRRTVRTGLARLGCPDEIAEAVIGHSKKGIQGTYNLHSYEPECRKWLQIWADHIYTLVQ